MSHKNLHVKVYCSFTNNGPNLEETKMSFSRWMDEKTVVHPANGLLFNVKKKKKKKATSHEKTGRKPKCTLLSEINQ